MRYKIIQTENILYLITYILYLLRDGYKKSHPRTNQGWDTNVFHGSTLVTAEAVTHRVSLENRFSIAHAAKGKGFFKLTKRFNGRTRQGISSLRLRSGIASYIVQNHCTKQVPLWEDDRIRVSSSQPFYGENLAYIL